MKLGGGTPGARNCRFATHSSSGTAIAASASRPHGPARRTKRRRVVSSATPTPTASAPSRIGTQLTRCMCISVTSAASTATAAAAAMRDSAPATRCSAAQRWGRIAQGEHGGGPGPPAPIPASSGPIPPPGRTASARRTATTIAARDPASTAATAASSSPLGPAAIAPAIRGPISRASGSGTQERHDEQRGLRPLARRHEQADWVDDQHHHGHHEREGGEQQRRGQGHRGRQRGPTGGLRGRWVLRAGARDRRPRATRARHPDEFSLLQGADPTSAPPASVVVLVLCLPPCRRCPWSSCCLPRRPPGWAEEVH